MQRVYKENEWGKVSKRTVTWGFQSITMTRSSHSGRGGVIFIKLKNEGLSKLKVVV